MVIAHGYHIHTHLQTMEIKKTKPNSNGIKGDGKNATAYYAGHYSLSIRNTQF
jgi:hypothetical protein